MLACFLELEGSGAWCSAMENVAASAVMQWLPKKEGDQVVAVPGQAKVGSQLHLYVWATGRAGVVKGCAKSAHGVSRWMQGSRKGLRGMDMTIVDAPV